MITLDRKDWFAFILGLFCCIELRIVGIIYLSELLSLPFAFLIGYRIILNNRYARKMLVLCVLWLVGQIIADLINGTERTKALKGEFTIILVLLEMPVVFWLVKDKIIRVMYFFIGYSLAGLLSFYFFKSFDTLQALDVWRVYAWESFALCVGAYLFMKGAGGLAILVTESFAIWTLFHGSRHVFLIVSIANVIVLFYSKIKSKTLNLSLKVYRRRSMLLFLSLGLAMFATIKTYEYSAGNGLLGDAAQKKYLDQKSTDNGLASGRAGFFIGLTAVKDNPIIGYGSFAQDKGNYAFNYFISHGYDVNSFTSDDEIGLIPTHSYLVGSWVYAGFLGALFWLFILFCIIKALKEGVFLITPKLIAMAVYCTIPLIWDILFSPFSYRLRFIFYIVMVIWYLTEMNNRVQVEK